MTAQVDPLLIDAFVGARVPRHLATVDALADAARVLAPAGALAINVVDGRPGRRPVDRGGLRETFADVAALGAGPVLRGRQRATSCSSPAAARCPWSAWGPRGRRRRRARRAVAPAEVAVRWSGGVPWTD